jgi:tRNA threonylcarbamoyladenosine biosynthesis protein TsaE
MGDPTPSYTFFAEEEADTARLAQELAGVMESGATLALDGDLGAGKTAFSQAVARYLGVEEVVNSPTFTIIKEYESGRLPLYHMDVYRISPEEAEDLGLDEYFYGNGVTLVEWASLIEDLLPERRLAIRIETAGPQQRRFTLTPQGEPYENWCRALKGNGMLK